MPNKKSALEKSMELGDIILDAKYAEYRLVRQMIERYGPIVFGDRWQTPLASAITDHVGREISVTQVNNWVKEKRPVPKSIYEAMHTLIPKLAADMRDRADRLERSWAADAHTISSLRASAASAAEQKKAL